MVKPFKPKLAFEIKNSKDFFRKLEDEYSYFDQEHLNPFHAMNCAITSWHLTDWTYQEYFNTDPRFQKQKVSGKTMSGLTIYQNYLKTKCPELEHMRIITNGTKHCKISKGSNDDKTTISSGDFSPYDYSRHDYLVPRFIIDLGNSSTVDFEDALVKTIKFWKKLIQTKQV